MTEDLTVKRKADRAKMAGQLQALVAEYGYKCERRDDVQLGLGDTRPSRCIAVDIETERGLRVSVKFDGASWQPDIYVVPWHVRGQPDTKLTDGFGPVNQFHRQKLTAVCHGFNYLMLHMRRSLRLIKSGQAFE